MFSSQSIPNLIRLFIVTIFIGCGGIARAAAPASAPSTGVTSNWMDLSQPIPRPLSDRLKMGGKNPAGVEINANSRYLTFGGQPWLPVMGEFHYTRYPANEWERELLKMKAGGISIVSTYVFWIHHEEIEGQFDWSGDHDLRRFIQLCQKHGLLAWVRLGPWCHGEVRNGGLPDWVLAKCGKNIRKNDPQFMSYVRTLYQQIFQQVDGLLWKNGGPIVGVQLDNEMPNNPAYLLALKRLAQDVGFDVPLYSVTGWNGTRFPPDEVLPLFGGYADGFWEGGSTVSKQDRKQFFFTHTRDDSSIGADLMPQRWASTLAVMQDQYPYLTCECGGGMETSYARRPLMSASDAAALALVKLGSGSNMLGYYMYHGGRNPQGRQSTLQESQATNYPNDLPVIRYDFQAPLGEFGQVRESYDALRILHTFLGDFGRELATMPSVLPSEQPKSLDDKATLRWAARSDGHRGFIFINNYQRGPALPERPRVRVTLKLADGELTVPAQPVTVPSGAYWIWPFNLDVNGVTLRYATAQPLCRVEDNDGTPCFVFFAPAGATSAQFSIKGREPMTLAPANELRAVQGADGRTAAKILLLTQEQAMHAYVAHVAGRRRLVISPDASLWFDDNAIQARSTKPAVTLWIFPATQPTAAGDGVFARCNASAVPKSIAIETTAVKPAGPARVVKMGSRKKPSPPDDTDFDDAAVWHVTLPKDALEGVDNLLLKIDYLGDVGRAYVGDRLIDDNFYFGPPWEIGLKRFAPQVLEKGLTIKLLPLRRDLPVYLPEAHRPATQDSEGHGDVIQLRGIEAKPTYDLHLSPEATK